ncbi:T9SS type A sorting domain-containing protein [Aureisphaera galaxeae]|uniref:T9SS type A sorting domain-containing protein n=1 Tax=Aureisphaera galaxeae TaxID=1538023 RepID=UPI00234FE46D|nr:T9SS type A sorting domain-containing protein [Aureisphaera galaxeae]MDC8002466.1 T9SS type A sorting domain-containing protein [Aureisphaera galaxeae]
MKKILLSLAMVWLSYSAFAQITFTPTILDSGNSVSGPTDMEPQDWDGDGDIDLMVTTSGWFPIDGRVTLYVNDGSGNFTLTVVDDDATYTEGAFNVHAVDLDEDGDLDALVAGFQTDTFLWYENDGAANFTRHVVDNNTTYTEEAIGLNAGDLDGDGDIDIAATAQWANTLLVYLNDGSENFTRSVIAQGVTPLTETIKTVQVIDLDEDGDLDLVTTASDGHTFAWWENDGTASFTSHIIAQGIVSSDPAFGADDASIEDIDGDGDLDIAGISFLSDHVLWFENDGSENFTLHVVDNDPTDTNSPTFVQLYDLDQDGDLDILTAILGADTFVWYENDGSQNFTYRLISDDTSLTNGARFLIPTDVDGDCKDELIAGAGVERVFTQFTINGIPGGCCPDASEYRGGSWDPAPPTIDTKVTITDDYDTSVLGSFNACQLVIGASATLTVGANDYINVQGDITVDGTLSVAHQGSVVQIDDAAVTTNNRSINVHLTTPNLASRDFMVLGSPMTGETRESVWSSAFLVLEANTANFVPHPDVEALFPGAENFADDNNDFWSEVRTGSISPGEGYIVRPQAGYGQPGGIFNYTYDGGTLNSGNINFTVIQNTPGPTPADNKNASPNILANPYASAISADDFIAANSMIDEVYFWEHLTPPNSSLPGAGSMNFSMEDISLYNLSGGMAAASDPSGTDTRPNGFIATAQGFGIKASAAGTATFTNAMRRTDNNNTLRLQEDKERVWFSLSNSEFGMQKQTLLAFHENATKGMDAGFDSRRLATVVSLFTHLPNGSEALGIQTLGSFNSSVIVPMGFSTLIDIDTEYKISIADLEGTQLSASEIYLVDHETGTIHDLKTDSYSFSSEMGTFNNRFSIHFNNVLSTEDEQLSKIAIYPNPTSGNIHIMSPNNSIEQVEVYDLAGRKVMEQLEPGKNYLQIDLSGFPSGVYMIGIKNHSGSIYKRIVKH